MSAWAGDQATQQPVETDITSPVFRFGLRSHGDLWLVSHFIKVEHCTPGRGHFPTPSKAGKAWETQVNGSYTRSKDPSHRVAGLAVNCPLLGPTVAPAQPKRRLLPRGRAVQLYCVYTIQLYCFPSVGLYSVYIVQFVQCVHCILVFTLYSLYSVYTCRT